MFSSKVKKDKSERFPGENFLRQTAPRKKIDSDHEFRIRAKASAMPSPSGTGMVGRGEVQPQTGFRSFALLRENSMKNQSEKGVASKKPQQDASAIDNKSKVVEIPSADRMPRSRQQRAGVPKPFIVKSTETRKKLEKPGVEENPPEDWVLPEFQSLTGEFPDEADSAQPTPSTDKASSFSKTVDISKSVSESAQAMDAVDLDAQKPEAAPEQEEDKFSAKPSSKPNVAQPGALDEFKSLLGEYRDTGVIDLTSGEVKHSYSEKPKKPGKDDDDIFRIISKWGG